MDDIGPNNNEESTFIRSDRLKSSSILRLTDVLCQHILLHPFVSLRRACQVNRICSPFICVQPFSLVPFIYHQQRKYGVQALYKGLSSELLVRGISLGTETALANYADWPTSVNPKRFIEESLKVLVLRGISVALCTPFLCSSVRETVQSVMVVQDRPSFIDCLRDGFLRILHLRYTPSARMIPIWLLVVPTVLYHVSHSAVWHAAKRGVELCKSILASSNKRSRARHLRTTQRSRAKQSIFEDSTWQDLTITRDLTETSIDTMGVIEVDSNQISNSIIASLIADVALLPAETVLHSLYIQGTRTIIDNVDYGEKTRSVLAVLTNYDSLSDCYQSIVRFEGNWGLYKGLGAIILQYSIHFILLRSLYYLLRELRPNTFEDSGNASRKPRAEQHEFDLRETLPKDQFDTHFEINRHSTPKNIFDYNRFKESDYGLSDTPTRLDQL